MSGPGRVPSLAGSSARRRRALAHLSPVFDLPPRLRPPTSSPGSSVMSRSAPLREQNSCSAVTDTDSSVLPRADRVHLGPPGHADCAGGGLPQPERPHRQQAGRRVAEGRTWDDRQQQRDSVDGGWQQPWNDPRQRQGPGSQWDQQGWDNRDPRQERQNPWSTG